jgi:hypothetical protein
MFLIYQRDLGVFNLTAGPFSVFPVAEGRVRPLTQDVAARRGDKPQVELSAFFDSLRPQVAQGSIRPE